MRSRRGEFAVLCILQVNTDVSPKLLSGEFGIAAPNLAVMLASLEKRGLVARVPNERDRRSMHLELTRSGRTALSRVRSIVETHEEELLRRLTRRQRESLFELLSAVHGIGIETEGE